jgi:hypothetical protein
MLKDIVVPNQSVVLEEIDVENMLGVFIMVEEESVMSRLVQILNALILKW